jgi:hypothetical protein
VRLIQARVAPLFDRGAEKRSSALSEMSPPRADSVIHQANAGHHRRLVKASTAKAGNV